MLGDNEIALIIAGLGALFTGIFVLVINTLGKRAQALAWLPSSIAILSIIWKTTNSDMVKLLGAAYSSQFILFAFVGSFSACIHIFTPFKPSQFTCRTIIIWTVILFCVGVSLVCVWLLNEFASIFWAFTFGTLGLIGSFYFVYTFVYKNNSNTSFETRDKNMCSKSNLIMIFGSALGTFIFVMIPHWLNQAGLTSWSGIFSNSPKIMIVVMFSLWMKNNNYTKNGMNELIEHLVIFTYSTFMSGLFIIIIWMNEEQEKQEEAYVYFTGTPLSSSNKHINFWVAWTIAFCISCLMVFIVFYKLWILNSSDGEYKISRVVQADRPPDVPKPIPQNKKQNVGAILNFHQYGMTKKNQLRF
tara:strand:+ start:1261 stop:2334 length:1074 start_codon:yes stop_codon:yes gene_type:complete